jgi:hypothetical protein
MAKTKTAGAVPLPWLPIFGADKTTVLGRVTAGSSDHNVSRFTGHRGNTLQTIKGRKCWVAAKSPKAK